MATHKSPHNLDNFTGTLLGDGQGVNKEAESELVLSLVFYLFIFIFFMKMRKKPAREREGGSAREADVRWEYRLQTIMILVMMGFVSFPLRSVSVPLFTPHPPPPPPTPPAPPPPHLCRRIFFHRGFYAAPGCISSGVALL